MTSFYGYNPVSDLWTVHPDDVECLAEEKDGIPLRDRARNSMPVLDKLLSARFEDMSHEDTVRALTELGFKRRGFNNELRRVLIEGTDNTRRPDAFLVVEVDASCRGHKPQGSGHSGGSVIVVEVDHSCPTPREKWNQAAHDADLESFWFFVVVIDRLGIPVLRWSCGDLLTTPAVTEPVVDPILSVECGTCHAKPGEKCRTRSGKPTRPHSIRPAMYQLYKKEDQDA